MITTNQEPDKLLKTEGRLGTLVITTNQEPDKLLKTEGRLGTLVITNNREPLRQGQVKQSTQSHVIMKPGKISLRCDTWAVDS